MTFEFSFFPRIYETLHFKISFNSICKKQNNKNNKKHANGENKQLRLLPQVRTVTHPRPSAPPPPLRPIHRWRLRRKGGCWTFCPKQDLYNSMPSKDSLSNRKTEKTTQRKGSRLRRIKGENSRDQSGYTGNTQMRPEFSSARDPHRHSIEARVPMQEKPYSPVRKASVDKKKKKNPD